MYNIDKNPSRLRIIIHKIKVFLFDKRWSRKPLKNE